MFVVPAPLLMISVRVNVLVAELTMVPKEGAAAVKTGALLTTSEAVSGSALKAVAPPNGVNCVKSIVPPLRAGRRIPGPIGDRGRFAVGDAVRRITQDGVFIQKQCG